MLISGPGEAIATPVPWSDWATDPGFGAPACSAPPELEAVNGSGAQVLGRASKES
jgi:hypothetical protein